MRRVGRTALRWAEGPGRQSGVWALNALVLAALPFLDMVRPDCATATCTTNWDRILFVPRALFLPALVAGLLFAGSWWAQNRHARVHKKYFAALPTSAHVDVPPGHMRPKVLEKDLARRTLAGVAFGGLLASLGLLALTTTRVALRSCDPWRFREPTGLQVCQGPQAWADMVVAFEVWILLVLTAAFALWSYYAARRIVVGDAVPGPRRRRRRKALVRPSRS